MFRTKTTLVIGGNAGLEIEMPDRAELLNKVAQGFDFGRLGTDLQTRDMVMLARHFEKFSRRVGSTIEKLMEAGGTIRTAARVSSSADTVLDQLSTDQLAQAAGKLALVYYTLQAEARSPLGLEPRDPGDLPLRGNENWLFQLSRMIVSGVPRNQAEKCFDNLSIISFSHDRSLEHYLPWVVQMAFGMTLSEARQLVGARLNITHPLGAVGRLPWQPGERPDVEWGNEEPWNLQNLVPEIKTAGELASRPQVKQQLITQIAGGKRIVFLGFGFEPQYTSLLFDYSLSHDPDILISTAGMSEAMVAGVLRTVRRLSGVDDPELITPFDMRPYQMLRDNALFLES